MPKFYRRGPMLKYIPLGGVKTTVNKNLHVYETNHDIVLVDCGIGFPDAEQLGVDVILPDISYLQSRLNKIRGIIITHAHYDHFGALPYLLPDLGHPVIYASKLTRGFIHKDLTEFNLLKGQDIHLLDTEAPPLDLGGFRITPFRMNHSVPDPMGLFIETPVGNFVHAADFKFDWTPVDGKQFEIGKLARLASKGVLGLMSDCLGAAHAGYTMSERYIQRAFEREIENAPKQIFITTVSSNISRIQQVIDASRKYGRRSIPLGRSVEQNIEVARNLKYLRDSQNSLTNVAQASKLPLHQRTYIIAGSYGQPGSALDRLARDENRHAHIKEGDVVIFSADPIPGVHDQVGRLIDRLTDAGARVVYSELEEDLHTSGHGSQGDLAMMVALVSPKHFVPIGGTSQHMRAYTNLVGRMGLDQRNVYELQEGQVLEFSRERAKLGEIVRTHNVFVDGTRVGDVGSVVLHDRQRLAEAGIFVVIATQDKRGHFRDKVEVVSRGFVYMAESDQLIKDVQKMAFKELSGKKVNRWPEVRKTIEKKLSRFLYSHFGRYPLVLAVLVES